MYRAGPGAGRAKVLNDNHSRLKAAKRKRQLLAEQLNSLKAEVREPAAGGCAWATGGGGELGRDGARCLLSDNNTVTAIAGGVMEDKCQLLGEQFATSKRR
jgi:hypothetical protein